MVAAATSLVAGVMTIVMGVVGRFPLGLATGLGLNAMLAYVIAPQVTWPQAMGLVVWEGIIILILVLTGFREAVFRAVPRPLRTGIAVGIGLFITLVGLADAGIVRTGDGTPLQLGIGGSLLGWPMAIFVIGLFLLVMLYIRRVRGAMLIAIVGMTVVALIVEAVLHIPAKSDDENPVGWALNVPEVRPAACSACPTSAARPGRPVRRVLQRAGGHHRHGDDGVRAAAGRLLRHHGHHRRRGRRGRPARPGRQPGTHA